MTRTGNGSNCLLPSSFFQKMLVFQKNPDILAFSIRESKAAIYMLELIGSPVTGEYGKKKKNI